jgi:signal transduction histidine kinase
VRAMAVAKEVVPLGRQFPSESAVTRLVAWLFLVGLVSILSLDRAQIDQELASNWPDLLFWASLLIVVNLLPVQAQHLTLTLDVPLTLAVAFLYEPALAALVAGVTALDRREVKREISLSRAAFNRAQIAASVYAASTVFHWIAPGLQPWYVVLAGTVAALLVDYVANSLLVMLFERINSGRTFGATLHRLKVGRAPEFLLTYLGYGLLALAIASLFKHDGIWAVAVFLIPIVVARQLLTRNQELHAATMKLRAREMLLERLFHGVVEERRDERARIAADLHDDVLQAITRVQQVASTLRARTSATPRKQDLEDLNEAADYSLTAIRQIMNNLKDSPLGTGGVVQTLRGFAQEVQLQSGIRVHSDLPGRVEASPEAQLVIFQVVREAVWNAVRHATASTIRISILQMGDAVKLQVVDDGVGFDPGAVDSKFHFGLQLMNERLEMIGGAMRLESRRGSGTAISATVPTYHPEGAPNADRDPTKIRHGSQ